MESSSWPEEASLAGFHLREWTSKPKSPTGGSCKLELPVLSTLRGPWSPLAPLEPSMARLSPQPKKRNSWKNKDMGQVCVAPEGSRVKGDFQSNPSLQLC